VENVAYARARILAPGFLLCSRATLALEDVTEHTKATGMNTHTWTFLTRLDLTSGVSIVINTKGRNANLTIGQTPEGSAQDVRRYIAPQSADEIAVLAEGMKLANERVADHQRAWDAHRAASRPAQSGKPNRGPGKAPAKPVLGLKALARADAAAKGPEALAEVQERQRAAAQADRAKPGRSELDREIRSARKGSQGAKPAKGGK